MIKENIIEHQGDHANVIRVIIDYTFDGHISIDLQSIALCIFDRVMSGGSDWEEIGEVLYGGPVPDEDKFVQRFLERPEVSDLEQTYDDHIVDKEQV